MTYNLLGLRPSRKGAAMGRNILDARGTACGALSGGIRRLDEAVPPQEL